MTTLVESWRKKGAGKNCKISTKKGAKKWRMRKEKVWREFAMNFHHTHWLLIFGTCYHIGQRTETETRPSYGHRPLGSFVEKPKIQPVDRAWLCHTSVEASLTRHPEMTLPFLRNGKHSRVARNKQRVMSHESFVVTKNMELFLHLFRTHHSGTSHAYHCQVDFCYVRTFLFAKWVLKMKRRKQTLSREAYSRKRMKNLLILYGNIICIHILRKRKECNFDL